VPDNHANQVIEGNCAEGGCVYTLPMDTHHPATLISSIDANNPFQQQAVLGVAKNNVPIGLE
jgi:hypothetical protein